MLRIGLTIFLMLLNISWFSVWIYMKKHPVENVLPPALSFQQYALDFGKVELHFTQGNNITFEKIEHKWFITQPMHWEANPIAVDGLLRQLSFVKPKLSFKINAQEELNNYGLTLPFCTLKCSTNEKTFLIYVGHVPNANNIYVKESGSNEIFVFDTHFIDPFTLNLEQWGNPFIFSLNEIDSIAMDTPREKLYICKEQNVWQFKAPITAFVDEDHTKVVCEQLLGLEYLRFLTPEETEQWISAFTQGSSPFTLRLQNNTTLVTLHIFPWNAEKRVYVARRNEEGPLFLFTSTCIERLLNAQETLRKRNVFSLTEKSLHKIVYKNESQQIALQRIDENNWELLDNTPATFVRTRKASLVAIKKLLYDLNQIYVEKFIQSPIDLAGAKRFDLVLSHNDHEQVAHFYQKASTFYLQFDGDDTVFQLAVMDEHLFKMELNDFRKHLIWKWRSDEVLKNIQIKTPDGQVIQMDANCVKKEVLSTLRVKQWLPQKLNYPLFATGEYTLNLETIDNQGIRYLYSFNFSDRIGGNLQCGNYSNEYFLLPQSWIDELFCLIYQPFWQKMSNYYFLLKNND